MEAGDTEISSLGLQPSSPSSERGLPAPWWTLSPREWSELGPQGGIGAWCRLYPNSGGLGKEISQQSRPLLPTPATVRTRVLNWRTGGQKKVEAFTESLLFAS